MGAICCGGNSSVNAGSVLDRVISQASEEDDCLLYRLSNYKLGGELVDAYNIGGQVEVEKLIKEQFGVLMYDDGSGQVIGKTEYLKWVNRDSDQFVIPVEKSLSPLDPLYKWKDHEACWQMQYRGSLGETLLHVLIICDTKLHTRLARTLLKCFPRLSQDVVEGEEYLGASALHLAIAYANNELVADLIEAGANVTQRAIGSFFLPRDQQSPRPTRHTDYEGLAYLGEYPLSWAACCSNESVYNLLIDSGAHPDAKDSFGNMILHMVVVNDKLDMFGYALRHPKTPASNGILNNDGFTPLTLSCQLGRADVFREMLELSCKEFWRYSNITCSAYPLNALDTLLPDGRTNWNSALFIILNGTKEAHLDMLDGGIIQRLLEEKWKTFAQRQFMKRLLILFLHLFSMSMAIYLRPTDRDEPLLGIYDWQAIARYCSEIGTICGVISYIIFQQGGEIKNQGFSSFFKQLKNEPAKLIFLISNIMLLACIPFRIIGDKNTEEAILIFAVPGSWFLLMFFAGAIRLTGPFVTMVYSMITGDMLTFGIIYSVIIFGFSQAFYFLYKGFPGVKTSLYSSYLSTWMALFQITLGDYNYPELSYTVYPTMSKIVFTVFMVLVPILLLNMLIAMMGNTYAHVIEQSEKEWMKQWAKIVVALERAVSQEDCHRYLQEYSIKLGPGDEPGTEQRGVLVIKSKSKTRARQRKGAVANWKRVGKVTINELRKRGISGYELRSILWGRTSITTPVKKNQRGPDPTYLYGSDDNNSEEEPAPSSKFAAFSNALDVMAFTHDIDLNTPIPGPVSEREVTFAPPVDPFRDLVINADNPEVDTHTLEALAEAAVLNINIENSSNSTEDSAATVLYTHIPGEPPSYTQVGDKHRLPTYAEASDSEGPLISCAPKLSRSKSSSRKYRPKENGITEKQKLVQTGSSSSSPEYYRHQSTPPTVFKRSNMNSSQRPKTARVNRVAPTPEVEARRIGSAAKIRYQSSPIDPLKPWSTRGIANMNALLAWGTSDQDSM